GAGVRGGLGAVLDPLRGPDHRGGAGAGRDRRAARPGGGARGRVHARAGVAVPGVRARFPVGGRGLGSGTPARGLGGPRRRGAAGTGGAGPAHRRLGGVRLLAAGQRRGRGGEPVIADRLAAWLRNGWRQLTSMRTALVLLFLLALAAIPGSVLPQRGVNPQDVADYYAAHPDLAPVLDRLGGFDVYRSPWFSAIYLLLFVSLVGCVVPRLRDH